MSSLADSPVDALAQEVRVTHVPRILLDHVHEYFAPRDAGLLAQAVVEADGRAEVLLCGDELLSECNLGAPGIPGFSDGSRVGDRAIQPKVRSGSCSVMSRKYRLELDACPGGFAAEVAGLVLAAYRPKLAWGTRLGAPILGEW